MAQLRLRLRRAPLPILDPHRCRPDQVHGEWMPEVATKGVAAEERATETLVKLACDGSEWDWDSEEYCDAAGPVVSWRARGCPPHLKTGAQNEVSLATE